MAMPVVAWDRDITGYAIVLHVCVVLLSLFNVLLSATALKKHSFAALCLLGNGYFT